LPEPLLPHVVRNVQGGCGRVVVEVVEVVEVVVVMPKMVVVVVLVLVVVVVVLVLVVLVVVVVVVSQGFGVQENRNSKNRPPSRSHWQKPWMEHWSKGPPGVLCVQHAEGGVVVVGSHGAPVQSPGPTLIPPALAHCSDVMTRQV
jgi:hypothetical protein